MVQFRPQWQKAYLSADYPLTPNLDAPKFLAGEQIVVDPSFDPKAHFPVRDLPVFNEGGSSAPWRNAKNLLRNALKSATKPDSG